MLLVHFMKRLRKILNNAIKSTRICNTVSSKFICLLDAIIANLRKRLYKSDNQHLNPLIKEISVDNEY